MSASWILALDQGTHASRAVLWDGDGQHQATVLRKVELQRPQEGWVEQDAAALLDSLRDAMNEALAIAREAKATVIAAGLATQRSTVVAWDRETGQPLAPALSWQDTRAQAVIDALSDSASLIKARTGLQLSSHYGASKLRWLLDHVPAVHEAARAKHLSVGPLASFLLFHLLEGQPLVCDETNVARTLLWNFRARDWDEELLALFQIPREILPLGHPVIHPYGRLCDSHIPLRVVSGDQNAALYATGRPPADTAAVNVGSGAFALALTATPKSRGSPLLSGIAMSRAEQRDYLLEGTVNGAGAALEYAVRQWGITDPIQLLEPWPECPDGVPIYMNAVSGLGSPWWRAGFTPELSELSDGREYSDACRLAGVAESIVFHLETNLRCLRKAGCRFKSLRISGGLSHIDGFCQRLADLTGLAVVRPQETEATARGIAWLASGESAGWEADEMTHFEPQSNAALKHRYTISIGELEKRLGE